MTPPSMMTDCIGHLNGSVYNGTLVNNSKLYDDLIVPIPPLTKTETFLHIIFISQAVPINIFIGLVFILNKQLQQTPRNAFWIGIIAVNLLTVLIAALRLTLTLTYHDDDQDGIVCFLFSLLTGKPYTILLLIQYLATLDRYYSESSPEFYTKYLTTRFVVFVQIYAFIFMLIATSLPQLTGLAALRCGFSLKIAESNMFLRSIYAVLCIFQFVKFHCKTRSNVMEKREALAIKKKSAQLSKKAANINSLSAIVSLPSKTDDNTTKTDEAAIKVNIPNAADNNPDNGDEEDNRVDRELVEANVKLLIDYVNLLMVVSPMLLFFFFGSYNNQMCEDSSEITTTVPSMGLSYFLYAVYGPLIFCFASKDFSKAVRQMFTRKTAAAVPKKNIADKEIGLVYSAFV